MKNILIILLTIIITSCLTERKFNKNLDKGIAKGWIDTSKTHIDTTFKRIDTLGLFKKVKSSINPITNYIISLKDTCYNKKGKVIGVNINPDIIKSNIIKSEHNLDSVIKSEVIYCLKKSIFFNKNGIIVEVSQDSLGVFNIKVEVKKTTINRPKKESWFRTYISNVWFLYVIILLLVIYILLSKLIKI